jgi:hypothetical protein
METYKDVEINGREFRIYPPSARDGSWVVNVATSGRIIEPDIYARAQGIMFEACRSLTDVNGLKIEALLYNSKRTDKDGGQWLIPDLVGDIATVDALWDDAVDFCLRPTVLRRWKKIAAEQQRQEESTTTP